MRKNEFPRSAIPSGFGRALAAERQAVGLTQRALASEAGLRRETIVRLEAGARLPTSDTVFRIAVALDLEPRQLVPGWPEWLSSWESNPGSRCRDRRRDLGLPLAAVAASVGVSVATLSRFERQLCLCPALAQIAFEDGMPEVVGLWNEKFARALGFADVGEHERHCGFST